MSIYKGLLFLDGFRVPAEYVEDVDASVPRTSVAKVASATRSGQRASFAPRWRRMLRGLAGAAGVAAPGGELGRCG